MHFRKTKQTPHSKSEMTICGLNLLLHAEYLTLPIVRLQFLFCDIFLSLERSIEFLNIGSSNINGPVVFLSKSKKALN